MTVLRLIDTGLPLDWLSNGPAPVLAAGAALADLARDVGADLVHLNTPALAAGASFGMPVLAVNHGCLGTWWDAAGKGPVDPGLAWLPDLTGAGLRAADRLVAPTRAYAEAVAARYSLPSVPAVVHNGRTPLPLRRGRPLRRGADGGSAVGRGQRRRRAGRRRRTAGRALHRGRGHGRSARRTFTAAHLRTTGPLSPADLGAWLARRPVFASAARFEPFGLAVLEAAQAGCPLVLSDIATFRELWDGAATFVPVDDAAGFADAIAALLADPGAHAAAGQAAGTRSARYTAAAMAQEMRDHYGALLHPQERGAA